MDWIGLFVAELWFGFYWLLSLLVKWKPIYRTTHKHRLSLRSHIHLFLSLLFVSTNTNSYLTAHICRYEKVFPTIDIFVCTTEPTIEPPTKVLNTALSVMADGYPTEKLSVYLSDDDGSDLTFYAILEAPSFSK